MSSADRRATGSWWGLAVLLSAFLLGRAAAQPPAPFGLTELARPDSLAADSLGTPFPFLPDSLQLADSQRSGPDSLARPADSLAAAADTLGLWRRFWRRAAVWPTPAAYSSPDPRPLPRLPERPDRPVEDLGEELLPLVAGPLFDQAEVGHRQELALDGLQARHSGIQLDGLELGSRLTGITDLNLLQPGLTDPTWRDSWQCQAGGAGGRLEFETRRARDDSVLTRVSWADGFMGYVHAEGEFARPLLGGRVLAASRQTFTHQRVPGAHFRGNLFLWNWDRPLGTDWLLRLDQRILRDASEILDHDGHNRHLRQSLLRTRLTRQWGGLASLGLDLWQRQDKRDWNLDQYRADRERLRGGALVGQRLWAGGGLKGRLGLESQRLSVDSWLQEARLAEGELQAAWTRPTAWGRLVLEPSAETALSSADDRRRWSLGARLGLTRPDLWADLLLRTGATPPTPEQLHVTRPAGALDGFSSPWLRDSGRPLLPDSNLTGTRWRRQELRLGTTLWQGRLPVSLRAWRVELEHDLLETPVSDSTWSWRGHDHLHWGVQLFAEAALRPGWFLRFNQGWFFDNRDLVSREFPSYLLDAALRHEHAYYGGELRVSASAGLHHEYGAVDAAGDALWQRPELWFQCEAMRRRFTLWWALRSPFSRVENARVEDRALHGHEEWLGVRWSFED